MKKFIILFFLLAGILKSYSQTVGLIQHNAGTLDDGYVLFSPISSNTSFLLDKCGRQVHTWNSAYNPGQSVYILPDGTLLRPGNVNSTYFTAGGEGGIIEKIDWDGNVIWSYIISDATKCQHHDIRALPNGNVLVIAWEKKTAAEAIAQGRNPNLVNNAVWSEQILEIQPVGVDSGIVVWEWHLWDHLVQDFDATKLNYGVIAENPQLVNINFSALPFIPDWQHMNSVDYNESLDQILLSSHNFDEIWIIDHSTTTAEATSHTGGNSGKGGDLLYRWGNPFAYGVGSSTDQKFFAQHNAHWIEEGLPHAGEIMVFNNGNGRPGEYYSTVEIIKPPVDGYNYSQTLPYLPDGATWIYNDGNPDDFYAARISGAQLLSNGNVLICGGTSGTFFETDSTGMTLWKYINPVSNTGIVSQGTVPVQNMVFRCTFYPYDYSGFAGHTLTAGSIIEDENTVSGSCILALDIKENTIADSFNVYPDPVSGICTISFGKNFEQINLEILNITGSSIKELNLVNVEDIEIDLSGLPDGVYFLSATTNENDSFCKKIIVAK